MKIDIRDRSERIEQLLLCLMNSHSAILHTLAHKEEPDLRRLRQVNDEICDLVKKLYLQFGPTLQ